MLDSIVRRHHRRQVRRARAAATLALVLALAGAGVGIGLSRPGSTVTALSPRASNTHVPSNQGGVPNTSRSEASQSVAPSGLAWVSTGSGEGAIAAAALPSGSAGEGYLAAGHLAPTGAAIGSPFCSVSGCVTFGSDNTFQGAVLTHLFTRISDGVTVRAFSARWTQAPLKLVPNGDASAQGASTTVAPASSPPAAGTDGAAPAAETGPVSTLVPDDTVTTTTAVGAPLPVPSPSAGCAIAQALVVEVSEAEVSGVLAVPLGPRVSRPIDVLEDQIVGGAKDFPIVVVVAHVSGRTQVVRARFASGAQDQMGVVDGWAVLVHKLSPAKMHGSARRNESSSAGRATVSVLASSGVILERAYLPRSGMLAMAVRACFSPGRMGRVAAPGSSTSPGTKGSNSSSVARKDRAATSSTRNGG
ncbi:MAG: hypothetical protein ABR925_05395 [Acidimicrobiales bacterium]